MPRKTPVKKREKEIGLRLRQARLDYGLTTAGLSVKVGIDSNRLASYEHGRNPVPFFVANKICESLRVNLRWIATGESPIKLFMAVSPFIIEQIPKKLLFSEVFDGLLSSFFLAELTGIASQHHCDIEDIDSLSEFQFLDLVGESIRSNAIQFFNRKLPSMILSIVPDLPPDLLSNFYLEVQKMCFLFKKKHKKQFEKFDPDAYRLKIVNEERVRAAKLVNHFLSQIENNSGRLT